MRQSGRTIADLRRRKREVTAVNAERRIQRKVDEIEFYRELFPIFLLIIQVGQKIPDEAWAVIRGHGVNVAGLLEEIAKLKLPPKEFTYGFPENLYEWFMANPRRAIQTARVIRANGFMLWWETRNNLIYIPNPNRDSVIDIPYTCIDPSDYLLDWLENDSLAMVEAANRLRDYLARKEQEKKNTFQELMKENRQRDKIFWKKTLSTIAYIGAAYLTIAGILYWKSGHF